MEYKIGIIGLGYVGLPLACLFAKQYQVIGYDLNTGRCEALNKGLDATGEISSERLLALLNGNLRCSSELSDLADCNIYVVTVPTPVDGNNNPDLLPLEKASQSIGSVLKKGDVVIYESTVYPGVTEEVCVPVLVKSSGLQYNADFFVGYSPERINPGDKEHTVEKIKKVTSGSTPETAALVDSLYSSVLENGTHPVSSIKVAEAAKVVENTQRDVNIAFMNELSKIFNAMNIDTAEVLRAAGTKWNFIHMKPGLVGGHCIGVDPYYLVQRAQNYGVQPRVIMESRKINDSMGQYVADSIVKKMVLNDIPVRQSRILLLGITFKGNCPDIRNTKVVDIYTSLREYTDNIVVYDPWASAENVKNEYGILLSENAPQSGDNYDAVVLCVAHREFLQMNLHDFMAPGGITYDVTESYNGHTDHDYRL